MICALPGCKEEFTSRYKRQRFCCKKHQEKWNNQQAAIKKGVKKHYKSKDREPAPRNKPVFYKPRPKRRIMTDAEQRKIDQAVDQKYAVKCSARVLRGAEFRQVAAQYERREHLFSLRCKADLNSI